MIKQLAHICINSSDLNATEKFYTEALGLELGFTFEKEGERFGFYLKLGANTFIEVFSGETGEIGNIKHMAIEVEDLDALLERIASNGYKVGEKSLGADHSYQAWVTDPDGVRIEFHEYTQESMQLRGGVCQVNW